MSMTLKEAIVHAEDTAKSAIGCECREEHRQLAEWLRELQERRKQPEIVRCGECKHNPKLEWFGCPASHLSEKQKPDNAWCWRGERRTDGRD